MPPLIYYNLNIKEFLDRSRVSAVRTAVCGFFNAATPAALRARFAALGEALPHSHEFAVVDQPHVARSVTVSGDAPAAPSIHIVRRRSDGQLEYEVRLLSTVTF